MEPRYQRIADALHAAGHGTSFRPEVPPAGMLVCREHADPDQRGRSILLLWYHDRFVLAEWGGYPAYAAPDEERLAAAVCDFLTAEDVRCMAINERLRRVYGLVTDVAFETESRARAAAR
jgi:hypothetical protein